MINLEHVVLASPEQMEFVIEGMRNPMNSWEKSDSEKEFTNAKWPEEMFILGENDHSLMQKLSDAGAEHRKYMRMIPVYVRITAPLYWWKEFDTYQVGVCPNPTDIIKNSCSTMHKIQEKEFTREDFSYEHIPLGSDAYSDTWDMKTSSMFFPINVEDGICFSSEDILDFTIQALNHYRKQYLQTKDKKNWWQMIQLLPSSYNQTRNVMLNYEVLVNIYRQRKNHKLDEWREFCKWIESLPYSEFVTGEIKESIPETTGDIKQVFGILESAGIKLTKEQLEELRKNGVFCYPVADPKKKETEEGTDQTDSFPIIDGEGAKVYDTREYAKEHPEWSEKIRRMVREDNN